MKSGVVPGASAIVAVPPFFVVVVEEVVVPHALRPRAAASASATRLVRFGIVRIMSVIPCSLPPGGGGSGWGGQTHPCRASASPTPSRDNSSSTPPVGLAGARGRPPARVRRPAPAREALSPARGALRPP